MNKGMALRWSDDLKDKVIFVQFLLLFVVALGAYWQTVLDTVEEWQGGSLYSHGWFSLLLVLGFLWRDASVTAAGNRRRGLAIVCMLLAGALWWVGVITSISYFQQLALVGLFVGSVWLLWGWSKVWTQKYILMVLVLAFPLWNVLQHPLRTLSTEVAYEFLRLLKLPVLRDGFHLIVPGGSFHVEPACAGLSFLLAATSLVFMFAAWRKLNAAQMGLLLVCSTAVAIVANWLRIIVIVIIGYYTNMNSILVQDHLTFGWVLFAVVYCPVLWFFARKYGAEEDDEVVPAGYGAGGRESWWIVVLGVLMLGIFPVLHNYWSSSRDEYLTKLTLLESTPRFGISPATEPLDWHPIYPYASNQVLQQIQFGGARALLYVAEYPHQSQQAELISSNNHLFEEGKWKVERTAIAEANNTEWLVWGGKQRVLVYTYVVGGQRTSSDKSAKILQLKGYFKREFSAYLVAVMLEPVKLHGGKAIEQLGSELLNEVVMQLQIESENSNR